MCRERLLSRIGYRGRKSFLASPLQHVLDALKSRNPQKRNPSVESIIKEGSNLLSLLRKHGPSDEYSGQTHHLKSVIKNASRLVERSDLQKVLAGIERGQLDPSTRKGIVCRLKKLSLYQKSARLLSQSAKMLGILRNVTATPISLAPECFMRTQEPPDGSRLPNCLSRCSTEKLGTIHKMRRDNEFASKVGTILKE